MLIYWQKRYTAAAQGGFMLEYVCPFCGYEQNYEAHLQTTGSDAAPYGIGAASARRNAQSAAGYNLSARFNETEQALKARQYNKTFLRYISIHCGKCGKLQPWSCYPDKYDGINIVTAVASALGITLAAFMVLYPLFSDLPMLLIVLLSFLIGCGSVGFVVKHRIDMNMKKMREADEAMKSEYFKAPVLHYNGQPQS